MPKKKADVNEDGTETQASEEPKQFLPPVAGRSFAELSSSLYMKYRVKIHCRDRICGGVPKNKDLIGGWIKARTGFDDELTGAQTQEAVDTLTEEAKEKSWTTFPKDDQGVFIWARQLKAMFRVSASMLNITTKKRGSKQILQHGFEIKPIDGNKAGKIYLLREGGASHGIVKDVDGTQEDAIHVKTPQGDRSALRRMDYVTDAYLVFDIWVLKTHASETRHIGKEDIVWMLAHAQEEGLGASRSQAYGKFDVEEFHQAD